MSNETDTPRRPTPPPACLHGSPAERKETSSGPARRDAASTDRPFSPPLLPTSRRRRNRKRASGPWERPASAAGPTPPPTDGSGPGASNGPAGWPDAGWPPLLAERRGRRSEER